MKHGLAFWMKASLVTLTIAWTGCIVESTPANRPYNPPPPAAQPPTVAQPSTVTPTPAPVALPGMMVPTPQATTVPGTPAPVFTAMPPTTAVPASTPATNSNYSAPPGARPTSFCPPGHHLNGTVCVPN